MKKMYVFTILLMFSVRLMAQGQTTEGNGFHLSFSPAIGLFSGQAEEIVYYKKGSDGKLSELLWNMKPLVYIGANINLDWLKPGNRLGFFAGGSAKSGLPMQTGIVEDRDWLGANNGVWLPDFLTHYSVSDNKTDKAFLVTVNAGVSFRIFDQFLLKPFISYSYMSFSWTAKGASFLYPYDTITKTEGHGYLPDSVTVLTYTQEWYIISPGLSFYGKFNRFFDIDISLKMSPLIWCDAEDGHPLRYLTTKETMDFGFFIEPKLVFSFTPNDSWALSLAVSYTHINGTRGDSEYTHNYPANYPPAQKEPDGVYKDLAGAGYNAFDIGLIARFKY